MKAEWVNEADNNFGSFILRPESDLELEVIRHFFRGTCPPGNNGLYRSNFGQNGRGWHEKETRQLHQAHNPVPILQI